MRLSSMTEVTTSRSMIEEFLGYNHNLRIGDGQFYEEKNLTSEYYPLMSPRKKRGTYAFPSTGTHSPSALISKDALCYTDGTSFYINNSAVTGLTLTSGTRKQLISMGAYVIIMPDKKYVNTADTTDCGDIEATYTSSSTVTYTMCKLDGSTYSNVTVSDSEPTSPTNMMLWIDTSQSPHVLKQYSSTSALWVQIATTYVKISAPNIGAAFSEYDGVKISGIDSTITQLQDLEGQTSVLYGAYHSSSGTDDYIIVTGILDTVTTQDTALTVRRRMPNLDFITECNNRLWGCRYGTDVDGNIVNEIYSCKLGDFKNWNCFMGLSTDSYVASCGTDGQWTGAITHLGYPLFFKENCVHKVYGNYPSNFQITSTACRGVQKGAGESLAIVDETLYYKSRNGVCIYDGSLPTEISDVFGGITYTGLDTTETDSLRNGAVAGSHNHKYYISMKSEKDSSWYLFVYDSALGVWHIEDNTHVKAFCSCRNELYYIADNVIKTVNGSGTEDTAAVEWSAVTGTIGSSAPDKKYISRMLVKMMIPRGSRLEIYIQYDGYGTWERQARLTGNSLRTFGFTIRPRRCDHFRLKFEGIGDMKIYSITETLEQGSDV